MSRGQHDRILSSAAPCALTYKDLLLLDVPAVLDQAGLELSQRRRERGRIRLCRDHLALICCERRRRPSQYWGDAHTRAKQGSVLRTGRILDLTAAIADELILIARQVEQCAAPRAEDERAVLVRSRGHPASLLERLVRSMVLGRSDQLGLLHSRGSKFDEKFCQPVLQRSEALALCTPGDTASFAIIPSLLLFGMRK